MSQGVGVKMKKTINWKDLGEGSAKPYYEKLDIKSKKKVDILGEKLSHLDKLQTRKYPIVISRKSNSNLSLRMWKKYAARKTQLFDEIFKTLNYPRETRSWA